MDCDVCGFRLALWTEQDLERTLLMAPHLAAHTRYGVTADLDDLLGPLFEPSDVHDVMHRLHLAGRQVHVATPTATGRVEQLSTSGGGVPKTPEASVALDGNGVVGDAQADRANHGRPWQAVCLWSAEVIEELQTEGHPIGFGSAGENVTVRGLDWSTLTPGVRIGLGEALLQVTSYAIPCAKNAQWFNDGYFRRMAHDVSPGKSRLYASVMRDGTTSVGDAVIIEP